MVNEQEIEAKKRERFEVMAVRLAAHLSLSKAEKFADLPAAVREHLETMSYCELVAPLMRLDKSKGHSIRMLATKYGLPKTTVGYHLNKNCPKK